LSGKYAQLYGWFLEEVSNEHMMIMSYMQSDWVYADIYYRSKLYPNLFRGPQVLRNSAKRNQKVLIPLKHHAWK